MARILLIPDLSSPSVLGFSQWCNDQTKDSCVVPGPSPSVSAIKKSKTCTVKRVTHCKHRLFILVFFPAFIQNRFHCYFYQKVNILSVHCTGLEPSKGHNQQHMKTKNTLINFDFRKAPLFHNSECSLKLSKN